VDNGTASFTHFAHTNRNGMDFFSSDIEESSI